MKPCRGTTATGARCRNKTTTGDCGRHTTHAAAPAVHTAAASATVAAADPFAATGHPQPSAQPAAPSTGDGWAGVSAGDRSYIEAAYAGRPTADIAADIDYFTAEQAAHTPAPDGAAWEVSAAADMVAEDLADGLRTATIALRLRQSGLI